MPITPRVRIGIVTAVSKRERRWWRFRVPLESAHQAQRQHLPRARDGRLGATDTAATKDSPSHRALDVRGKGGELTAMQSIGRETRIARRDRLMAQCVERGEK